MLTFNKLKSLSHHAYCLIGAEQVHDELISVLEKKHKITVKGNSDFFDRKYQIFTIDDSREIKSVHGIRPIREAGKKIFVLTIDGITIEAQNALLKLLEEPAEYAHFFIIIPSAHLLLPTIKSRLFFIDHFATSQNTDTELKKEAQKFIEMSATKRIEWIKSLKNAIGFIDALESIIYKDKGIKKGKVALETISTVRKYLHDRAPSVKMLLEYVALNT